MNIIGAIWAGRKMWCKPLAMWSSRFFECDVQGGGPCSFAPLRTFPLQPGSCFDTICISWKSLWIVIYTELVSGFSGYEFLYLDGVEGTRELSNTKS